MREVISVGVRFPKSKHAILAYTAGIVDGEGSIIICQPYERRGRLGYCTQLRVCVTNTNEWLMQWLKMQYGGTIVKRKKWKTLQRKPTYDWVLSAIKARAFLELILPYLVLKLPQAELAINFQKHKKRGAILTENQIAAEEAERLLMKKLNRTGS